MKKQTFFIALILSLFSLSSRAQQTVISGKWQTPNKDFIEFYSEGSAMIGKQVGTEAENDKKYNNKIVVKELKSVETKVFEGTVVDPKTDKTYHGRFTINESGAQLELKIKLGFLSHNEVWKRVN
ncbi:MAG: DUF2147 domain-containing protein [Mucilaginibacter sp.]|nr:DUF2147 domain-containing protein [Mucilaginibacter sp.]